MKLKLPIKPIYGAIYKYESVFYGSLSKFLSEFYLNGVREQDWYDSDSYYMLVSKKIIKLYKDFL